jgi:hypothetical protein
VAQTLPRRAPGQARRPSASLAGEGLLAGLRSLSGARFAPVALFGIALGLGIALRSGPITGGSGFPFNDGGMFLAMVDDVRRGGFSLPHYASYNGGDIPFAYPPLGFYMAAAAAEVTGSPSIDMLRYLPVLFSILTLPAFFLLARSMLRSPLLAALAMLVFACIPRAYNWEIVGGGLTRSPGFFFATLALWQVYELFTTGRRRHLLPAAAFSSLTVLTHMEMGWFLACSTGLFLLWHRSDRGNFASGAALAAAVVALTAPWWASVILRFGLDPFLSAAQTGGHSPVIFFAPLFLHFTDDALIPVAAVLAVLGTLASVRDRRYLVPVWLALIFILDPRKAATTSTLPLAMLASVGLVHVLWPLMKQSSGRRAPVWAYLAAGFMLIVYAPMSALLSSRSALSPLYTLSTGSRDAMAWVAANTNTGSRFLVVPSTSWAVDGIAEWFPVLAGRISITTVQGSEWLGKPVYEGRKGSYEDLLDCTGADVSCIDAWSATARADYTHVYVSKGDAPFTDADGARKTPDCCAHLLVSLRTDSRYVPIFENDDAVIFERLTP